MAVIRMHSQARFELLNRVHFPARVALLVLQHHERCDHLHGRGESPRNCPDQSCLTLIQLQKMHQMR